MPYSAQLAPTASAKRRFVELQFLVKSFDVGYTLENVNGVGILGNGGPFKKSRKAAQRGQWSRVVSSSTVLARQSRAPFPIPFGLIDDPRSPVTGHRSNTLLKRSTGSFYHITYCFQSIWGANFPPRDPCLCPSTTTCTAEAVCAFRALFTPFSPRPPYNDNASPQVLTSNSTLVPIVQDDSLRHLTWTMGLHIPTQPPRTASSCFQKSK